MLLMIVAALWGVSAVAVIAIFAVDERAFRRRSAVQTSAPTLAVAFAPAPASARSQQLASRAAG
jgi:hypothetical protein